MDHAAATATGEEERVRELAEMVAGFEVGCHEPGVVVACALRSVLERALSSVVHLHACLGISKCLESSS